MCGGSTNHRWRPAQLNGDRLRPTASMRPERQHLGARQRPAHRLRRLQRDAVRGAAADDDEVAGRRGAVLAVAAALPPGERLDVEHRAARRDRVAVAEPEPGADPGPERDAGVALAQPGEVGGRRGGSPTGSSPGGRPRSAGRSRPLVSATGSTPRGRSSGRCSAKPSRRRPSTAAATAGSSSGRMPCRFIDVRHSTTTRAPCGATCSVLRCETVWMVRPGAGPSSYDVSGPTGVSTRMSPPNAVGDLGDLAVGADGDRVDTEHGALLREPRVADAVAVALGDRDESGQLGEHLLVVRRASAPRRPGR